MPWHGPHSPSAFQEGRLTDMLSYMVPISCRSTLSPVPLWPGPHWYFLNVDLNNELMNPPHELLDKHPSGSRNNPIAAHTSAPGTHPSSLLSLCSLPHQSQPAVAGSYHVLPRLLLPLTRWTDLPSHGLLIGSTHLILWRIQVPISEESFLNLQTGEWNKRSPLRLYKGDIFYSQKEECWRKVESFSILLFSLSHWGEEQQQPWT